MQTQLQSTRTPAEMLKTNQLVKHYAGSLSYGTNLPTSDVDLRGIFCADPINVRTPFFPVREVEVEEDEDTKLYELSHFMKLCLDCNPNIIETLWVDRSDIVATSEGYELLREHRHGLLSSKIAYTTCGYAMSQLKRIKGHNKWINQPQPDAKPEPCDFVSLVQWFGSERMMPGKFDLRDWDGNKLLVPFGSNTFGLYHQIGRLAIRPDGSLNDTFDGAREDLPVPIAVLKFRKEEWVDACDKWTNYWKWKNNRNEARSELEEVHGYDTKHAMHLVRLLRMGVEVLRDEEIHVKRPDAQELLDIRNGSMTYDELLAYATTLEKDIFGKWVKETKLRKKPNIKLAAKLLMDVQDIVWAQ